MSVGQNIRHDSAITHVTGESIFIDDRPHLRNEVLVGVLGAPVSAGLVKKIDFSEALTVEGVLAVYTAKDFPHNRWGTIVPEQPILVDDVIGYMDEPLCIIAGTSDEAINRAKKLIKVEVEEQPAILSIDQGMQAQKFICVATPFIRGDADTALKNSPNILKGVFECGGQEHFYMESQATVVYPLENGQLEVHSSSQHPTETQHVVAHALHLDFSQVVCIV